MKWIEVFSVLLLLSLDKAKALCSNGESLTFSRWSGVSADHFTPVFVYSASGDEASLAGSCLARCRELVECAAVLVQYGRGSCTGVAKDKQSSFKIDSDAAYFQKICLNQSQACSPRWWSLETTPGYQLHSEGRNLRTISNVTMLQCYQSILGNEDTLYRSAQWISPSESFNDDDIKLQPNSLGSCVLNGEDKFTEPESYRVANYHTFYIENQCRHDYSRKIERCSYEEYYNQTLRHVEFISNNATKDECKSSCEKESRFICRGFTWSEPPGRGTRSRGVCDLHSEDLVTTGSWLLRRASYSNFYRRVICLNLTVECEGSALVVTYRPRGLFRGRVYVPGRGDQCSARAENNVVRLELPMLGDCEVNFAYAITNSPTGVLNRTMAYTMVMVQNNPIIQTAGDRWLRVGCAPSKTATLDAAVRIRDTNSPSSAWPLDTPGVSAASAVLGSRTPVSMYVVRSVGGAAPPHAALGEPLELRLDTNNENEIMPYHLVASSRLGDNSVLLLDSRGCPTGQVDFPAFTRTWTGGMQRLSARFKAFRFPTSHVVRFALMVRYCDGKCPPLECEKPLRSTRDTNTTEPDAELVPTDGWSSAAVASVAERGPAEWSADVTSGTGGVLAQAGAHVPLELELTVGARDVLSADTLVHADHSAHLSENTHRSDTSVVCVHELLLVALVLAWLAVQILILVGCCVMVKRYRNLAEMNMQKDYQSFDNVGFDTVSTHRRVHWPDQTGDLLHT